MTSPKTNFSLLGQYERRKGKRRETEDPTSEYPFQHYTPEQLNITWKQKTPHNKQTTQAINK